MPDDDGDFNGGMARAIVRIITGETAAMLMLTLAAFAVAQTPSPTPDLSWMAGYWLDCANGREASETWSDPRVGLMVGHAVTVSAQGRASFEIAHMMQTPKGFAYIAQPGGAPPTTFLVTKTTPNRAVFANPDHDFPTRITYERTGDVLNARIEGTIDGKPRSMSWAFKAAPLNTRCPA